MLDGVGTRIKNLIDRIGRTVQVRVYVNSGTSYDPTRTPSDTPARATLTQFKAHDTDGSIIQADDKRCHIAASSTVTKQDKIIDGSLEYNIINLRLVAPGDEPFLYIAQLRA